MRVYRRNDWLLLCLVLSVAGVKPVAAQDPLKSKEKEAKKGFKFLLEDDAKKNWIGYGTEKWPDGWEVTDGVLHRKGSSGDLMTVGEYGDFDLRLAWKISEGGNSGIMYRVSQEEGPAYHTGPEYQVLDNAKHADGKSPLTSTGSLYALYPPTKEAAKPVGEWNRTRIVVRGNRVRHFLNGEQIVDAEIGSDDWKTKVAGSKFAALPKFGKNVRGHIVLQDHGDEVWYRNVRIKELE